MPLRALLLDFNSYFASVEQQLRPELRGRPLGILPVVAETTCCIAASYQAKRFGVKTGTSVADARQLCPDIVFVLARPAVYVEMHHRLMAIVDSVIAVGEVLSIDEVACDLTGSWQREEVIRALSMQVKARIREQVGECMTCSIGIGPNRFLAKTASNMQKPDGLTVIHVADLPGILYGLKLADLNGIGRHMLERLNRYGIYSVEALCAASREQLRRVWGGVEGARYHDRLRGIEVARPPSRRGSIGHSHVLPPHLRYGNGAWSVLSKLTQKAALRLRSEGYLASRMAIRVSWRHHDNWESTAKFTPMSDTLGFLRILAGLWAERPGQGRTASEATPRPPLPSEGEGRGEGDGPKARWGEPVKVGVVLSGLAPAEQETLPLFEDGTRSPGLDAAFDKVRRKFGNDALYFGGAFLAAHEAPMRIAFNHIPDQVLESDGP